MRPATVAFVQSPLHAHAAEQGKVCKFAFPVWFMREHGQTIALYMGLALVLFSPRAPLNNVAASDGIALFLTFGHSLLASDGISENE
jgi:hypothetical protein